MKSLLAVVGDGQAVPLLETALLVARRFGSRVVGLNAVTAEYAVVFGGEMGLTISSEVDRSVEHESEQKRNEARDTVPKLHGAQRNPGRAARRKRTRARSGARNRAGRIWWSARWAAPSTSSCWSGRPSSIRWPRRRSKTRCSKAAGRC